MSEQRAHSEVGASNSKRWLTCPGSVRASRGVPDKAGPWAAEGTVAHDIAECVLGAGMTREDAEAQFVGRTETRDGYVVRITTEMIEALWVYVEYVRSLDHETSTVMLEQRVHVDEGKRLFQPGTCEADVCRDHLFGTVDCIVFKPEGEDDVLHIVDYKHGSGVNVEAIDNTQMRYYALAALTGKYPGYKFDPLLDVRTVRMTIVQPRIPNQPAIKEDEIDAFELLEWGAFMLVPTAATALYDRNAPLVPSDECRFCPAAPRCPALRQRRMEEAFMVFNTDADRIEPDKSPDELSVEEMAQVLEAAGSIRSWLSAVERRAQEMLMRSESVPGYKLVQKRATRQWIDPDTAADTLCATVGMGDDELYDKKIKSPAQIERVIGRSKEAKTLLNELVESVSSGLTIAPNSDRRPGVVPDDAKSDAADVFDDVD